MELYKQITILILPVLIKELYSMPQLLVLGAPLLAMLVLLLSFPVTLIT
jgi:hypothetical protein